MPIRIEQVTKAYGGSPVLQDFSLELADGSVTCLCGESGCGKTTLLRLLAGLEKPDQGKITGLDGRRVGYLFQEHRLIPSASTLRSVALALPHPVQTTPPTQAAASAQAAALLRQVGLAGAEAKFPAELSGGMRQRAAIARLLAFGGDLWLLDEPFKELDPDTRTSLQALLRTHWAGKTVVLVTHDPAEAALLGDRIVQMTPMRKA